MYVCIYIYYQFAESEEQLELSSYCERLNQDPVKRLTFNEVGVVAALPQLHHGVHQVGHVGRARSFGQEGEVLLQDGAVVFLLNVGELNLDDGFLFGRQLLLHVLLQPAQHHGLQDRLKLLHLWAGETRGELKSHHSVTAGCRLQRRYVVPRAAFVLVYRRRYDHQCS